MQMVEIGGTPTLFHTMIIYSHYCFDDYAVALGYEGNKINRYFAEYGTL